MTVMKFDYFYEEESENFQFMRFPRQIFDGGVFKELSMDARCLYMALMDRIGLSRQNGWKDGEGHLYVYYTIESVKEAFGCGNSKACRMLKELRDFGLIERVHQGCNLPAIIFVKNFKRFLDWEVRDSQNGDPGVLQTGSPDTREWESNNTEINNTESNKTDPILSGEDKDMKEREALSVFMYQHLGMETLYERYPLDGGILDEIFGLIMDVMCSNRKSIRIAADDKPINVVKSQFMKLNSMHIEYVLGCMKKNPAKVRNIKQYILATVYNAAFTMENYFQALVNNDMAEGRI